MNADERCAVWRAPQERFERILADAFRRSGPRLTDLAYANAWDGPDGRVVGAMRNALDAERELSFQYTPYGGATTTRRRIAAQLSDRFGLSLNFKDVVLTPGAMAALNATFRALFDDGRELLVLTPCWLDYPLYLAQLDIPFRLLPLAGDKHLDLGAIERAIDERTGGLIFSHPGCPSGVILRPDELRGLAELLGDAERRHGAPIWVVGDEVHRDVVWSGERFDSVLSFHPNSVSVYSFGKSLFLQGQRIGYVAVSAASAQREALREQLVRTMRAMGFCTPTHLMQRAVVDLLDYTPPLDVVAHRQRAVREALFDGGFEVCAAGGTFFVYARCPPQAGGDDFAFVEGLARQGVLVLPSSVFHESGWFRVSVTARDEALDAALPLLREAG